MDNKCDEFARILIQMSMGDHHSIGLLGPEKLLSFCHVGIS